MAENGSTPWWDGTDGRNESAVRHTPDRTSYLAPDSHQLSKIDNGPVKNFVTIPAALPDGRSSGFDHNDPGPVHVDPDAPDGGVVFDPCSVDPQKLRQAVAQAQQPHHVFYALGTPSSSLKRRRGSLSTTPDVPSSSSGRERAPASAAVSSPAAPAPSPSPAAPAIPAATPVAGPAPYLAPAPVPPPPREPAVLPSTYLAPAVYHHPLAPVPPAAADPNVMAMMQAVVSVQQQLAALVAQRSPENPLPSVPAAGVGQRPAPGHGDMSDDGTSSPVHPRLRRSRPMQEAEEVLEDGRAGEEDTLPSGRRGSRRGVRSAGVEEGEEVPTGGFETLNLPWVTGPVGNRAKRQVFFEIPGAGKHSARYHDVIDSDGCVVLVYDTRFEDGTQYLPPNLGETQLKLHVPHLKKSFTVGSMGLHYSFGVFDHIVLVKGDTEHLDYDER